MKKYQVWWRVDWSNETYYRECEAENKEGVIELYHLNTVDVKWVQIDEMK